MKHFARSSKGFGFMALLAAGLAITPGVAAQARGIAGLLQERSPLLLLSSSQGYLGVDLADVEPEKAQALKLKEVRGAVITLREHDASAGQMGLTVNPEVPKLNRP